MTLWPPLDFDLQLTLHQLPSNQPAVSPPPRAQMNWWLRGNGFYIITRVVSSSALPPPPMWVIPTTLPNIFFSSFVRSKTKSLFLLILLTSEIMYLKTYIPCLSFSVSNLFNCPTVISLCLPVASTQIMSALQLSSKPVTAKAAALNPQSSTTVRMWRRMDVTELQLFWGLFFMTMGQILCVNIVQTDVLSACSSFPRTQSTYHQRNL